MSTDGLIIKALSGFYYVKTDDGLYTCRARGKFRLDGTSPLVGDYVTITVGDNETGTITALRKRKNLFLRPAVANLDILVMIVSEAIPVTDPYLIDRITVRCEQNDCVPLIVINKCDLASGDKLVEIYSKTPYKTLCVSAETKQGLDDLRRELRGKVCCFTGNSGVGKSSLLNALDDKLSILTGSVSEKLGRGRHTTRHVELYDIGNQSFVVDTPGFASLDEEDIAPIPKEELAAFFPEFTQYITNCRFPDCRHIHEPSCAVRNAAEGGLIHPSRYSSYKKLYEEAAKRKSWELK